MYGRARGYQHRPGIGMVLSMSKFSSHGRTWDHLKSLCIARDGMCVRCGTDTDLTADHILSKALGGEDNLDNLQTLCRSCNAKKGAAVEVRNTWLDQEWFTKGNN
jgi:5-methylcytosine-specific restriction endonuclease McrA